MERMKFTGMWSVGWGDAPPNFETNPSGSRHRTPSCNIRPTLNLQSTKGRPDPLRMPSHADCPTAGGATSNRRITLITLSISYCHPPPCASSPYSTSSSSSPPPAPPWPKLTLSTPKTCRSWSPSGTGWRTTVPRCGRWRRVSLVRTGSWSCPARSLATG